MSFRHVSESLISPAVFFASLLIIFSCMLYKFNRIVSRAIWKITHTRKILKILQISHWCNFDLDVFEKLTRACFNCTRNYTILSSRHRLIENTSSIIWHSFPCKRQCLCLLSRVFRQQARDQAKDRKNKKLTYNKRRIHDHK